MVFFLLSPVLPARAQSCSSVPVEAVATQIAEYVAPASCGANPEAKKVEQGLLLAHSLVNWRQRNRALEGRVMGAASRLPPTFVQNFYQPNVCIRSESIKTPSNECRAKWAVNVALLESLNTPDLPEEYKSLRRYGGFAANSIRHGMPPNFERSYLGKDKKLWRRCMQDGDLRLLAATGGDKNARDSLVQNINFIQEMARLAAVTDVIDPETGMHPASSMTHLMTAQERESKAISEKIKALDSLDQNCSAVRRLPSSNSVEWEKIKSLLSIHNSMHSILHEIEESGEVPPALCRPLKSAAQAYKVFFQSIATELMGPANLNAFSIGRAGDVYRRNGSRLQDALERIETSRGGRSTEQQVAGECQGLSEDFAKILCTDFSSLPLNESQLNSARGRFELPRCDATESVTSGVSVTDPREERFGYDEHLEEDREVLDRASDELCESYSRWVQNRCPKAPETVSKILRCHTDPASQVDHYCQALKTGGLPMDPVCIFNETLSIAPTGASIGGPPVAQQPEEVYELEEIVVIGKRQRLAGAVTGESKDGDISAGMDMSLVDAPATSEAPAPHRPLPLPRVAPPLPLPATEPLVAAEPPASNAVPVSAPPVAAAASLAPGAGEATGSRESADLRRELEMERLLNAELRRRVTEAPAEKGPAPVDDPVRGAPATAAQGPVGNLDRFPAGTPRAAGGATAAPLSFPPATVEQPVRVPPDVAAVAPAPAGAESVSTMASNVAVARTLGVKGRVVGPMLIAGVEVGTTPENSPLDLPAPPTEVSTVDGYVDYIRGLISPELLQQRGPVIVQVGAGGSIWKVELRDGQIVVEPVGAEQITQVRRYYASALREALDGLAQPR